jgi:adenosine deaminase
MQSLQITHALDWNAHYLLELSIDADAASFHANIRGPSISSGRVERHLATLIQLHIAGAIYCLRLQDDATPSLQCDLPEQARAGFKLEIRLGGSTTREGELFARYRVSMGTLEYGETFHKLTVFETRMLGNQRLYRWLPYPRHPMQDSVLTTDLHTHSSAQISSQGLLEVAAEQQVPYPTRLLDILGIAYHKDEIVRTRRFFFPPTDAGHIGTIPDEEDAVPIISLSEEARERLGMAMHIRPDMQVAFGELEMSAYRFRTPITKHPDVAYGMLLKTAQEYARYHVSYAEITATTTSLLIPDYLETLHEWLPAIAEETGVHLRFLAGLPRNLPPHMLQREVDTLLLAAASPYIVGVDFMGFEDNKIAEMAPYIEQIAAWAKQHDRDFTLRIHAGENRKNLSNVRESLQMAVNHNMRVRIGHAAHGLDDEAMQLAEQLAKESLVMIEFNPDSNLALNNIDRAEELEITACIDRDIPFVICSDGSGLFQTHTAQLEIVASFAGVNQKALQLIAEYESAHIAREKARFDHKMSALPDSFFEEFAQQYQRLRSPPTNTSTVQNEDSNEFESHLDAMQIAYHPAAIRVATKAKRPILILGATGERYWQRIHPNQQSLISELLHQLPKLLDPTQHYIMIGRPKDAGLTAILSRAVQQYNVQHPDTPFALVSATVQADRTLQSFTPGVTHVIPLEGSLFTVPHQLVHYIRKRDGLLLCIGGGTFVRDAILTARDCDVAYGLMNGPAGASTDKAVMTPEDKTFKDLESLEKLLQCSNF